MERLHSRYEKLFYGVKVQLITTKDCIPTAFNLTTAKTADAKTLGKMIDGYLLKPQFMVIMLI